jgi:hypothetical protein
MRNTPLEKTRVDYLILTAILLFHFSANYVWLENDLTEPTWDPATHAKISFYCFDMLQTNKSMNILVAGSRYPPFVYLSSAPFYLVLGKTYDTACLSLLFFYGILIFSVYGIGRQLYERKVGLFSAFIVSMYPAIFGLSRQYYLDFPLAAMSSLGVYAIIHYSKSKNLSDYIVLGLILFLGMMTKAQYLLFIIGPLVIIQLAAYLKRREFPKKFFSILYVLFIFFSLWLFLNESSNSSSITTLINVLSGNRLQTLLSKEIFHYLFVIISQTSLPLFLFFPAGLFYQLTKEDKKGLIILSLWILVPYVFFTMTQLDHRYIMPVLPAIAVLSASIVPAVEKHLNKKAFFLWAAIFVFSIVQFAILSFGASVETYKTMVSITMPFTALNVGPEPPAEYKWMKPDIAYYKNLTEYNIYFSNCGYPIDLVRPPSKDDWRIGEILYTINKTKKRNNPEIFVIPNYLNFNANSFSYYSTSRNFNLSIHWVTCPENMTRLMGSDYIITKTGYLGTHWGECSKEYLKECRATLSEDLKNIPSFSNIFQKIASYNLPDGSEAEIFAKKDDLS